MADTFHLLDLISQAAAVEKLLHSRTAAEKIAWLAARGELRRRQVDARVIYDFRSRVGRECTFFLDGDTLVFHGGDHHLFTA